MENTWKFEWANPNNFKNERKLNEKAHDEFVNKWKNKQDYLEKDEILKEALDDYEKLIKNFTQGGKEGYYYWLKQELNENDLDIRAKCNLIEEFIKIQNNKLNFFEISLGKIPKEKQNEFLKSNLLKNYKNFLKQIFLNSKYMLNEKEEKIMSLKSTAAYSMWVRMVSSLLTKETKKIKVEGKILEKTYTELLSLMKNQKKELRDNASIAFEEILSKYSDVAEAELNAILENHKVNDKIRGFDRVDSSRIIRDNIDKKFVDDLIEAVSSRFDISKKFYELKAKLFGQNQIGYYERAASYGEIDKKYTWEESKRLVKKVFSKLDSEFLEIFDDFLQNKRIDVFPKKGKRGGAFCIHNSIKLPTYILLNHTENLDDVTTIAHEIGHGINNEFIRKKQNALSFGTPLATAEVASTFMEDFVLDEILKTSTDEEKLIIFMQKLDSDISTIMRQISCYLFEKEIHETYRKEGYLSKEKIGKIFKKRMSNYLGNFVDTSTCDNWWIYWPHIREIFYVYSYASGLLISKTMQEKYKEDNSFIEKIKEFLSTGNSKTPRETFEKMGIELNKDFWNKGLDKIEKLLNETWNLAKKMGKI
jgi:oligoendopeptidase F